MPITRRDLMTGAGAALALAPNLAWASTGRAERRFRMFRGGDEIGTQVNTALRDGDQVIVTVDASITVKVLGLTAYRYELSSREVWRNGELQALDSRTNDDGDKVRTAIRRAGGGLVVDGTDFSGSAPADAATTSYWTPRFLQRPVWLSTQSGKPLAVSARRDGTETVPTPGGREACDRWRVTGDLEITLFYDPRGEWVGSEFDAGGEVGRLVAVEERNRLAALWPAG